MQLMHLVLAGVTASAFKLPSQKAAEPHVERQMSNTPSPQDGILSPPSYGAASSSSSVGTTSSSVTLSSASGSAYLFLTSLTPATVVSSSLASTRRASTVGSSSSFATAPSPLIPSRAYGSFSSTAASAYTSLSQASPTSNLAEGLTSLALVTLGSLSLPSPLTPSTTGGKYTYPLTSGVHSLADALSVPTSILSPSLPVSSSQSTGFSNQFLQPTMGVTSYSTAVSSATSLVASVLSSLGPFYSPSSVSTPVPLSIAGGLGSSSPSPSMISGTGSLQISTASQSASASSPSIPSTSTLSSTSRAITNTDGFSPLGPSSYSTSAVKAVTPDASNYVATSLIVENIWATVSTSTAFSTRFITIFGCPESVTDCPARSGGNGVQTTTDLIVVSTSICPITVTQSSLLTFSTSTVPLPLTSSGAGLSSSISLPPSTTTILYPSVPTWYSIPPASSPLTSTATATATPAMSTFTYSSGLASSPVSFSSGFSSPVVASLAPSISQAGISSSSSSKSESAPSLSSVVSLSSFTAPSSSSSLAGGVSSILLSTRTILTSALFGSASSGTPSVLSSTPASYKGQTSASSSALSILSRPNAPESSTVLTAQPSLLHSFTATLSTLVPMPSNMSSVHGYPSQPSSPGPSVNKTTAAPSTSLIPTSGSAVGTVSPTLEITTPTILPSPSMTSKPALSFATSGFTPPTTGVSNSISGPVSSFEYSVSVPSKESPVPSQYSHSGGAGPSFVGSPSEKPITLASITPVGSGPHVIPAPLSSVASIIVSSPMLLIQSTPNMRVETTSAYGNTISTGPHVATIPISPVFQASGIVSSGAAVSLVLASSFAATSLDINGRSSFLSTLHVNGPSTTSDTGFAYRPSTLTTSTRPASGLPSSYTLIVPGGSSVVTNLSTPGPGTLPLVPSSGADTTASTFSSVRGLGTSLSTIVISIPLDIPTSTVVPVPTSSSTRIEAVSQSSVVTVGSAGTPISFVTSLPTGSTSVIFGAYNSTIIITGAAGTPTASTIIPAASPLPFRSASRGSKAPASTLVLTRPSSYSFAALIPTTGSPGTTSSSAIFVSGAPGTPYSSIIPVGPSPGNGSGFLAISNASLSSATAIMYSMVIGGSSTSLTTIVVPGRMSKTAALTLTSSTSTLGGTAFSSGTIMSLASGVLPASTSPRLGSPSPHGTLAIAGASFAGSTLVSSFSNLVSLRTRSVASNVGQASTSSSFSPTLIRQPSSIVFPSNSSTAGTLLLAGSSPVAFSLSRASASRASPATNSPLSGSTTSSGLPLTIGTPTVHGSSSVFGGRYTTSLSTPGSSLSALSSTVNSLAISPLRPYGTASLSSTASTFSLAATSSAVVYSLVSGLSRMALSSTSRPRAYRISLNSASSITTPSLVSSGGIHSLAPSISAASTQSLRMNASSVLSNVKLTSSAGSTGKVSRTEAISTTHETAVSSLLLSAAGSAPLTFPTLFTSSGTISTPHIRSLPSYVGALPSLQSQLSLNSAASVLSGTPSSAALGTGSLVLSGSPETGYRPTPTIYNLLTATPSMVLSSSVGVATPYFGSYSASSSQPRVSSSAAVISSVASYGIVVGGPSTTFTTSVPAFAITTLYPIAESTTLVTTQPSTTRTTIGWLTPALSLSNAPLATRSTTRSSSSPILPPEFPSPPAGYGISIIVPGSTTFVIGTSTSTMESSGNSAASVTGATAVSNHGGSQSVSPSTPLTEAGSLVGSVSNSLSPSSQGTGSLGSSIPFITSISGVGVSFQSTGSQIKGEAGATHSYPTVLASDVASSTIAGSLGPAASIGGSQSTAGSGSRGNVTTVVAPGSSPVAPAMYRGQASNLTVASSTLALGLLIAVLFL